MDFSFTPEQQMLVDSLSRLLGQHYAFDQRRRIVASADGRSERVWADLRDMGLLALPVPESLGGLGGSIVDVVAIGELMGRHLVVDPWLTSAALSSAVVAATDPSRAEALLNGSALAALAHEEGAGTADPALIGTCMDAAGRVTGEKALVIAGDAASVFIVSARDAQGMPALYLVDGAAEGLSRRAFTTIDGRRAAHLRFDAVAATPVAGDPAAVLRDVLATALIGLCAEAVGAMGALLETTAAYALTRKQFGVPIASFQAIAHRQADMKLAYVKARSLLLATAALAEAGQAGPHDLSVLKAQVGRLGRQLSESAVQIHGGVGMTDELSVGHYLKRILCIDAMLGSADYHLQRVGAQGRAGEARP